MSEPMAPAPSPSELPTPWASAPGEVAETLGTDPERGLSAAEVSDRRERYGENRLAEPKPRSLLATFLGQLKNPLLILLLFAATVAAFVGHLSDAAAAFFVVALNLVLGTVLEQRADRSLRSLRSLLGHEARVLREGGEQRVPAEQLVPGDVLLLDAGDRVPADARVLDGPAADVEEAALTGESVPVTKSSEATSADAPLAERSSMLWSGTLVVRGRARAVITATGMATEVGRIARATTEGEDTVTPLTAQLARLTRRLGALAGAAVAAVLVLGFVQGRPLAEILLQAAALAVAAIPEGLPTVVTVTLALGMSRMAKRRALVKHLADVETLGSCNIICSDKTGTLTENRMRVATARGDEAALAAIARACNDASVEDGEALGDPTEVALLEWARERTEPPAARTDEVPFDPAKRFMATAHDDGSLLVKGALEAVLAMCSDAGDTRERSERDEAELADEGMRVLALARGTHDAGVPLEDQLKDLELVGLLGLRDPLRAEAKDAIARCRDAGIHVIMLTGDSPKTASAIARDLGLEGGTLTGREVKELADEELAEVVARSAVFARLEPSDKERVVASLVAADLVVAVTGDGVNDAPALRRAHIGVALGQRGTEVAKDAAEMILTDDNFATVVAAIEQGRAIWDNLGRFLRFQLATSLAMMSVVLLAPLLGLPAPLTALQILWINLIMDGPPAVALGVDPPDEGVMHRPPRPREAQLLDLRRFLRASIAAATMATGTLYVLATAPTEVAPTLAFTTLTFFQVWNALAVRAGRRGLFSRHTFQNPWLWGALGVVVLLQAIIVHAPWLSGLFRTVPLSLSGWGTAVGVAASVLLVDAVARRVLKDE